MTHDRRLRRQLRELSQIHPDGESTRRAIAAAKTAIANESAPQHANPWSLVMTRRRTAVAAATILLAVAALALLNPGSASRNVAFAEVVNQLEGVKTVQYVETRTHVPRPGEPAGPTEVTKKAILGRSRERTEVVSVTAGDPLPEGHSWSRPTVGHVLISDLALGKIVSLDTVNKAFSEVRSLFSISPDDGKLSESTVQAAPEVDFYARIRDFPAATAERLPQRELAGKAAVGFRTVETIDESQGGYTWTRTVWVDAATNLPVQIEVLAESTHPRMGNSKWVLSDIVFDQPLDESLFSTDPPQGYKVRGE